MKDSTFCASIFGDCAMRIASDSKWGMLLTLIESSNNKIVPIGNEAAEFYIAIDHSQKNLADIEDLIPMKNRILILREPRTIRPDQYRSRIAQSYGTILSCAPQMDKNFATHTYLDGYISLSIQQNINIRSVRESICMINENKFSLHLMSKYSLRQKALEKLAETGISIDVAGRNWERGYLFYFIEQFKSVLMLINARSRIDFHQLRSPISKKLIHRINFIGYVENQREFLSRHNFVLIIENDFSFPTEKIFNAIDAGCIPIYFGPAIVEEELPSNSYLRITHIDQLVGLLRITESLSMTEIHRMSEFGQLWIRSDSALTRWTEWASINSIWQQLEAIYS
jgi:hypothetical protein